MKLEYSDTPVLRETVELNGIHADAWINQESWLYEKKKLKNRFISFPIWKFCTPKELRVNHPPSKLNDLILNLEKSGVFGEASEWFESLKDLVVLEKDHLNEPISIQTNPQQMDEQDIPF